VSQLLTIKHCTNTLEFYIIISFVSYIAWKVGWVGGAGVLWSEVLGVGCFAER